MKNKIFLCILMCMAAIGMSQAQQTELFRFVSMKVDNEGSKLVLHHDLGTNKANAIKISNETFNARDGFLQAFILRRTETGKVLIASAKKKNYFLKRKANASNSGTNELEFSKIEEGSNMDLFTWEMVFAGNNSDEVVIQATGISKHGVGVFTSGNAYSSRFSNTSGNPIGNGGTIDDTYRFTIQRITNVF